MARDVAECTLFYCASVRALALGKLAPFYFYFYRFSFCRMIHRLLKYLMKDSDYHVTQISGLGCQSEMILSRGKRVKQRFSFHLSL